MWAKMLRALLRLCLLLCMLPAVAEAVEVSATAAVLLDADTGQVLYEKNGDEQMLIASTTKIMTAMVVLEQAGLDDTVTVTRDHMAEGSSMYLKPGETVRVEELLYGLLLCSGNDAALALTACAGGPEPFVALMNEKAAALGMTRTSFANPNGLDAEGHYSTARDMAVLAAAAMEEPTFRRICSSRSVTIGQRTMENHNRLLRQVEGCIGLKTGYTKAAGRTLVSCAERCGCRLIAVTLRDSDRPRGAVRIWFLPDSAAYDGAAGSGAHAPHSDGGVGCMDTVGEWRRMKERLQKLIASAGLCARRTAEEWIAAGRVRVNGEVAVIGGRADPETDTVTVDGRPLPQTAAPVYLMLNKPRGYVTTLSDECGRQTAAELVAGCGARVYPVGRLDRDSEGLLLFTNDGDFAQRLLHPRHQVDKVYLVTVRGDIRGAAERLMAITELDGEPIAPAQAEEVSRSGGQALLRVTIHQGKNRQVRRMCARIGLHVARLQRVQEDTLLLGGLPTGKWRYLTDKELQSIKGGAACE